jgi:hypothetical protein
MGGNSLSQFDVKVCRRRNSRRRGQQSPQISQLRFILLAMSTLLTMLLGARRQYGLPISFIEYPLDLFASEINHSCLPCHSFLEIGLFETLL